MRVLLNILTVLCTTSANLGIVWIFLTVGDLSFLQELFVREWCIVILFVTLVRLQERVWVDTHRFVKNSRLYSASGVFQLVFCWHLGSTGLSSTATPMESTKLVPQFPLLIVAKVQRELWPSLFFFMRLLPWITSHCTSSGVWDAVSYTVTRWQPRHHHSQYSLEGIRDYAQS